eukprot:397539-Pyramimonas_sp.AAC.1
MPEGVRALGQAREVIDRMVEVVTMAEQQPTQTSEGLQQIFQQVMQIRKMLAAFEDFGENLDTMQEQIQAIGSTLTNVEHSVGQLGQMMIQLGSVLAGIAQAVSAQMAAEPVPFHSQLNHWYGSAEAMEAS